jgi:hypothetical protein
LHRLLDRQSTDSGDIFSGINRSDGQLRKFANWQNGSRYVLTEVYKLRVND